MPWGEWGVKGILKPPRFGDVGVSRAEAIDREGFQRQKEIQTQYLLLMKGDQNYVTSCKDWSQVLGRTCPPLKWEMDLETIAIG